MKLRTPNQNRPARSKVAAFSLVEVMIAAAVTAIVMAALFAGISATFKLLGVARENLRATQVMVSRLEGLRLCAWSSSQLFNTNIVPQNFTDSFYPLGLRSTTNYGTVYTGTITVTTNFSLNPPVTYSNKLALTTVSVSWITRSTTVTNIHQRSITTLIAQNGIQNYLYSH